MRPLSVLVSCLAIGSTSLASMAQDAPRRQRPDGERPAERQPGERGGQPGRAFQLSPEKAKAAWELTATGVAKRLGFSDDQIIGVVKAYTEARTSHSAAQQKVRDEMRERMREGGDDEGADPRSRMQEMQKAIEDLNKAERAKLVKSLTDAVGADSAEKAAASLGLFAPNWDRMVDAIAGFKLEAAKQQEALNAVESFIVAQSKLARDMDREERQAAARESREKLVAALKPILSEEQLGRFEQSTGGGRGRGGEGGGRPNRGGGGGGGF